MYDCTTNTIRDSRSTLHTFFSVTFLESAHPGSRWLVNCVLYADEKKMVGLPADSVRVPHSLLHASRLPTHGGPALQLNLNLARAAQAGPQTGQQGVVGAPRRAAPCANLALRLPCCISRKIQ
eukprot:COSAG01_NODE_153_length_23909_cov_32.542018_26_plen_123_part_00